jgi:hypothetical protein
MAEMCSEACDIMRQHQCVCVCVYVCARACMYASRHVSLPELSKRLLKRTT